MSRHIARAMASVFVDATIAAEAGVSLLNVHRFRTGPTGDAHITLVIAVGPEFAPDLHRTLTALQDELSTRKLGTLVVQAPVEIRPDPNEN